MSLHAPLSVDRLPRREDAFKVPRPIEGAPGRYVVDATCGTITPMQPAPSVRTVGELKVSRHIAAGQP